MTRLRTTAGIHPGEYEKRYLLPFAPLEEALQRFSKQGYAQKANDGSWSLTPEGFLISNSIITDLLLIQDSSKPLKR